MGLGLGFLLGLELGLGLVLGLELVFGLGLGLVMTVRFMTVQILTVQTETGNPFRLGQFQSVNGRFADNLAHGRDAREIDVDRPASSAVDGNTNTYSCTLDNTAFPWWAVDLGTKYHIGSVVVTLTHVGGAENRNYRLSCKLRS